MQYYDLSIKNLNNTGDPTNYRIYFNLEPNLVELNKNQSIPLKNL